MFTHYPIRIIQFSDSHLLANTDRCLLGVNPYDSFRAVLSSIKKQTPRPDVVMMTGDIAQEGCSETYPLFWNAVEELDCPVYALPGNHDDLTTFKETGNAHQRTLITLENWQILCLETPVKGQVHGFLTEQALAELESTLLNNLDKHLIVCLHHHPTPIGSAWLDESILANHAAFASRIRASLRVRAVLFGHVHQAIEASWGSVQVLACPSTCFQFKPKSAEFTLDREPPGYRWLELYENGSLKTGVIRLTDYPVTIDEGAKGY